MTVILLNNPVEFPIAGIRALLKEHVPLFRWQCGDRDQGGSSDIAPFDRPHLIMGRSGDDIVMINVALHTTPYAGNGADCPPHSMHIMISQPTIDDDEIANRLRVLICAGLIQHWHDSSVRIRLKDGGRWLEAAMLRDMMVLLAKGAAFENPPAREDHHAPAVAVLTAPINVPTPPSTAPTGLATLTLMLDGPLALDWPQIGEAIKELDPDGGWTVNGEANGRGFLLGRGGMIALLKPEAPVPSHLLDEAFARSWWLEGDRSRIINHQGQLIISATVEADAPFAEKLAYARIMSLIACIAAKGTGVAGVYNVGIGTILDAASVADMLSIVACAEIPIPLWTWCAWHSLDDGNVSFSSGGFEPFLGYEIEVWNAPVAASFVQEKVSGILRYLLDQGPVIGHGDTCGATEDDRAIRCFLGDSRVDRNHPTRAMFIEFGLDPVAQPVPDEPVPAPETPVSYTPPRAPAPPPTGFGRRAVGGFGRKGL
jgi:Domain of unknown function (DUF4261)